MKHKWNERWLEPPPVCLHAKLRDQLKDGFVTEMMAPLSAMLSALSTESALSSERFILQRLVYKLNNQQRKEKAFRGLHMIVKCLQRYLDMDLKKMVGGLASDIERIQETEDKLVYLPSLQSVQYYLCRLMGGAGLLAQTTDYCRHIYTPIREQMTLGHFLDKNLVYLGLIARIWVFCRYLVGQIENCYDQIHRLLQVFPASQAPWLCSSEQLPSNFKVWLQLKWPLFYHEDQRSYVQLKHWSEWKGDLEETTRGTGQTNKESGDNIVDAADKHIVTSVERHPGESGDYKDLDTAVVFGMDEDIGVPWAESSSIPSGETSEIPLEDSSYIVQEDSSAIPLDSSSFIPLDQSSFVLGECSSVTLEEKNTFAKKSRRMCVKLDYEQLELEVRKCKSPRRLLQVMKFLRCVVELMWRKSNHVFGQLVEKHTSFITEFMNKHWDGGAVAKSGLIWCKKRVQRKIVKAIQAKDRTAFQRGIVRAESLQAIPVLIDRFVSSREGITRLMNSVQSDGKMVFGSCSIILPSALLKTLAETCKSDNFTSEVDEAEGDSNSKFLTEVSDFKVRVVEAMEAFLPRKFDSRFTDVGKPRKRRRKKKSTLNISEANSEQAQTLMEIQDSTLSDGGLSSLPLMDTQPKTCEEMATEQCRANKKQRRQKRKLEKYGQKEKQSAEAPPPKCGKVESVKNRRAFKTIYSSSASSPTNSHVDKTTQLTTLFPEREKKRKKQKMKRQKKRQTGKQNRKKVKLQSK